jgi:hypothetical protein
MHALHRPHVSRAMMVTVTAAVLTIVLTLALAPRLNDLVATPAPTGAAGPTTALPASTTSPGWTLNPFAPLLSAPARIPWAPAHP